MDIPDDLSCLFTARVEDRGGEYVIEIPEREVTVGGLRSGEVYRVGILPRAAGGGSTEVASRERDLPVPPVDEGDTREVEIEDIGEQGDGIARIERGYIVFVPETGVGDRVTIDITDVRENFAFGEVVEGPY